MHDEVNINQARRWLAKAIERHERHMDGTESTSKESQRKMMDEMLRAMEALGVHGGMG